MAPINMAYNPANVLMGSPSRSGSVYMPTRPVANPQKPQQPQSTSPVYGSLDSEAVRATGSGPYDSAYRQNLATYAGGLMNKPGGLLAFNPTDPNSLQGQPTGAGNAPIMGTPGGLLDKALGGSPFSWTPPPPQQAQSSTSSPSNYWKFWLNQYSAPFNNLQQTRNSY